MWNEILKLKLVKRYEKKEFNWVNAIVSLGQWDRQILVPKHISNVVISRPKEQGVRVHVIRSVKNDWN